MLKKKYLKRNTECSVTFVILACETGGARTAALLGDFNGWDREATPMKADDEGNFSATVRLEPGREYGFRYLLDGTRWENDWSADKYVASPYGDAENGVVMA